MRYPEYVLIPVFMFADYFLTVAGTVLKDREYSDHFKSEHYELNPIWQKQIAQKKWLNPKHIALTIIASSALIFLAETGNLPERFAQGFLGCFLVFYGMIVGRHLSNLMLFRDVNRNPNDVSGQVSMSHDLLLRISIYRYVVAFVPLALIAVLSPSPFVYGAAMGPVLLVALHLGWIRKYQKHKRKTANDQNV